MKHHRFLASKTTRDVLRHLERPWKSCVGFGSGRAVVLLESGQAVLLSTYVVEKEPMFECERIEAELNLGAAPTASKAEQENTVQLVEFEDHFGDSATCISTDGVLITHPNANRTLLCCSTSFYQLQVLTEPDAIDQWLVGKQLVERSSER